MPTVKAKKLPKPSGDDPLGFGLKSFAKPLQRWWLIEKGNPYFDADIRKLRPSLEIPERGFTDPASYVDWVSRKMPRHGHDDKSPITVSIKGLDDPVSLTKFHYQNLLWPVLAHELPGRCCPKDPLFEAARILALSYQIESARFEPGFPGATESVVGYLLLNLWPHRRSTRDINWTQETTTIDRETGETFKSCVFNSREGLESRAGEGSKLAIWYGWWKFKRGSKKIREIFDDEKSNPRGYDERTVRTGIKRVEELMRPVDSLSHP